MDAIRAFVQTLLPFEFLQFDFMVNALLAILLLTPLLGLLGTMAVNQQMAFFSDALGHSALTGIGLGILLGVSSDLLAMLVFGIVWALLICRIKQTGAASTDTIISVFSSTSVAAGVLVLSMGGGFAKYSSLLVGDVLAVQDSDLLYLLIALVAGIALWAVMYNSLLLSGISPSLARSRGIHNRLVECAFVVLVAVAVHLRHLGTCSSKNSITEERYGANPDTDAGGELGGSDRGNDLCAGERPAPQRAVVRAGAAGSPDIPRRMQYGGVRGAAIPCQPGNDFCCDGNALARRTLCAAGASGDAL